MIYEYEANILNLISAIFPNIKIATYATDDNIFEMMREVTKFPAFFYQRENAEWSNNKILTVRDGVEKSSFVQYEQKYKGKILVENQGQAITVASQLRFGISRHPFITVHFPTRENGDAIDVQFRLTSVGIGEDRSQANPKGALRWVDFSWQSQLFMSEYNNAYYDGKLVEKINIWLNPETNLTEAQIHNETGVFTSIPLTPIHI